MSEEKWLRTQIAYRGNTELKLRLTLKRCL